jgi:hypothetical protein
MAERWDLTVGQLEALSVALYVRDVLRLHPHTSPTIPAVEPPADGHDHPISPDVDGLGREWERWWEDLIAECGAPGGMGRLVTWNSDQDLVVQRRPSLYAAAAGILPEAQRWAEQQRLQFAASRRSARVRGRPGPTGLEVERRALDRATRRRWWRRRPLVVRIVVLPVGASQAYRISPNLFLVTARLVLDSEAYGDWLNAQLSGDH